jgi:hypothetical protein
MAESADEASDQDLATGKDTPATVTADIAVELEGAGARAEAGSIVPEVSVALHGAASSASAGEFVPRGPAPLPTGWMTSGDDNTAVQIAAQMRRRIIDQASFSSQPPLPLTEAASASTTPQLQLRAPGNFGSPEEAPADTVMQRPPNLVLNQSSVADTPLPSASEAAASMTPEALPAAASLVFSPTAASLALSPASPFVTGPDDASNQVVIQQTETARRRFIDIINSEPSARTVFGEARGQAGAFGSAAGTLSGVAAEAKAGDLSSPPDTGAIIPAQASGGSQFRLDEAGRIDLVPDPPANTDERQQELYDELRHKTRELTELGHNQLADLSTPADRFREALQENIEAVSITRLWSRGNTLRRRLAAHEIAVGSAEPSDPARLTPLVAGRLRDLVETFNVFIAGDPEGSVLEQARLGPQERAAKRAIVVAAEPIVEALRASPDIATQSAAQALTEQIEAAQDALSATGIDSDQAVALAGNSSSNAVITLLRQGVAWLGRGAADDVKSGFYRTIGGAMATGAIGGAVCQPRDRDFYR